MWWGIFFKKNPPVPKGWELEQRASWWALPIAHGRHSKPEVPWTVEFAAPFRMNDRNKTCMIGSGLKLFRMDSKEILEAAGTIFKRGWLTVSHVLEVLGIQILSVQRAKSHLNWAWPSPAGQSRQWGQGGSMSSIWLVVCSHLWLKSVGEERWRKYSWQEMVERMQMLRNWAMSLTRDLHRGSVAQHFWAAFLIGSNWHKVPMKRSEGCHGLLQLPKRWPSESGQWQRTIGFVDRLVVDVSLRKRNSAWKTCFPMVQLLNSQGPFFFWLSRYYNLCSELMWDKLWTLKSDTWGQVSWFPGGTRELSVESPKNRARIALAPNGPISILANLEQPLHATSSLEISTLKLLNYLKLSQFPMSQCAQTKPGWKDTATHIGSQECTSVGTSAGFSESTVFFFFKGGLGKSSVGSCWYCHGWYLCISSWIFRRSGDLRDASKDDLLEAAWNDRRSYLQGRVSWWWASE